MNLPSFAGTAKIEKSVGKSMDLTKVSLFLPAAASMILSVLITILVVWPRFNDVLALRKSNLELSQNAAVLEKKVQDLSSVDKDRLRKQLTAAEQLIPSDKNIFTFIKQVEEKKDATGIIITNLSVGTVGQFSSGKEDAAQSPAEAPVPPLEGQTDLAASVGANEVQMKLSIASDYRSIVKFLNSIYTLPRVVTVEEVSFVSDEAAVNTNMTINALWQSIPAELPVIESPLAVLTGEDVELLSKVETSGAVSAPTIVPEVPKGKTDIFTPFQ